MIPPSLGWSRHPASPARAALAVPPLDLVAVISLSHWWQTSPPARLLAPGGRPHPQQVRERGWGLHQELQGNQFRIKTEDEAKIGFQERNYLEDGRIVGNTTYNIEILNNISEQNGSIFPILLQNSRISLQDNA